MHDHSPGRPNIPADATLPRAANLLGAFALEAATAQTEVTARAVGQSGAAAAALTLVAASPGRTIEQLRGPLGLSQPGATRLFERLNREGWIDRGDNPGRGLQIRLSPDGEAKLREILAARRAALVEMLQPLDDVELQSLSALLGRLLSARTTSRAALERLCRICERGTCLACPVGHALDVLLPQQPQRPER